jgi:hypothetical protein
VQASRQDVVTMDPDQGQLSFAQAVAIVAQVADRASQVAAGLRALREPEAAALVTKLAEDASRASAALRRLLETSPKDTDWYQVHRDMWVRYGDPGDLAAMTDQVNNPI